LDVVLLVETAACGVRSNLRSFAQQFEEYLPYRRASAMTFEVDESSIDSTSQSQGRNALADSPIKKTQIHGAIPKLVLT
jgi:hypothetical protein